MPIIGVVGSFGHGKTLIISNIAKYDLDKHKRKIYANFKLNFDYEPISLDKILSCVENNEQLSNCDICLDEVYLLMDSRAHDKLNQIFSYFIMQTRKRDVNLVYSSQLYGMVDLRLRDLASLIIICVKRKDVFNYVFCVRGYTPVVTQFPEKFMARYYGLYDHKEIIDIGSKVKVEQVNIKNIYEEFKKDEVISLMKQDEAICYLKSKKPFLTISEGKTVYKMIMNPDLAKAILKSKDKV
jgi:hypothetical protein